MVGIHLPSQISAARTLLTPRDNCLPADRPLSGTRETDPYLDRDFIEFVLAIPTEQLLRPGERRS